MTNAEKIDVVKGEIKLLEGLSPSPSEKPLIEEALEIYGRVIDDLRSEGKSAPAKEEKGYSPQYYKIKKEIDILEEDLDLFDGETRKKIQREIAILKEDLDLFK